MSTGLPSAASLGRKPRSWRRTSSASSGISSPAASQASAHMIPGPPALVRIPTRGPRGRGWEESSDETSSSSAIVSARITPDCSKSASVARSDAASSAPVWEPAARAPAPERPLLTTTTGFSRPTRLATREKRRGSLKDSM